MYTQAALLAFFASRLAVSLNTGIFPGIDVDPVLSPDATKTTKKQCDRLVQQGKLVHRYGDYYSLPVDETAKRALALKQLEADYTELRARRDADLREWQSWQCFKKYGEAIRITCEPGLTERDKDSYGWLCYTGEYCGKRVFVSPITARNNADSYEEQIAALDRLIVCVENNLSLSLA